MERHQGVRSRRTHHPSTRLEMKKISINKKLLLFDCSKLCSVSNFDEFNKRHLNMHNSHVHVVRQLWNVPSAASRLSPTPLKRGRYQQVLPLMKRQKLESKQERRRETIKERDTMLGFRHGDKSFFMGFSQFEHLSLALCFVRPSFNHSCHIEMLPSHPCDITDDIRTTKKGKDNQENDENGEEGDIFSGTFWMDTKCVFVIRRLCQIGQVRHSPATTVVRDNEDVNTQLSSLSFLRPGIIPIDSFIELCLSGVSGIAVTLDVLDVTHDMISFSGQVIYSDDVNPHFFSGR